MQWYDFIFFELLNQLRLLISTSFVMMDVIAPSESVIQERMHRMMVSTDRTTVLALALNMPALQPYHCLAYALPYPHPDGEVTKCFF